MDVIKFLQFYNSGTYKCATVISRAKVGSQTLICVNLPLGSTLVLPEDYIDGGTHTQASSTSINLYRTSKEKLIGVIW